MHRSPLPSKTWRRRCLRHGDRSARARRDHSDRVGGRGGVDGSPLAIPSSPSAGPTSRPSARCPRARAFRLRPRVRAADAPCGSFRRSVLAAPGDRARAGRARRGYVRPSQQEALGGLVVTIGQEPIGAHPTGDTARACRRNSRSTARGPQRCTRERSGRPAGCPAFGPLGTQTLRRAWYAAAASTSTHAIEAAMSAAVFPLTDCVESLVVTVPPGRLGGRPRV